MISESDYDTGVLCTECGNGNYFEYFTEEDIENNRMTPDTYKCMSCGIVVDEKMFRKIIYNDLGAKALIDAQKNDAPTEYNPHEGQNDW